MWRLTIVFRSLILLLPLSGILYWFGLNFRLMPTPGSFQVEAGRRVYENSGCPVCHSRFVRNSVTDIVRYLPDVYLKKDFSPAAGFDRFGQGRLDFFSRRIGPDLEYLPVTSANFDFLENYLKNPRAYYPGSMMPSYDRLFREKLTRDEISFARGSRNSDVGFETMTRGQALLAYLKEFSRNEMYRN